MKAVALGVVGVLGFLIGLAIVLGLGGLVVMLIAAGLHAFVSPAIPAVGFIGSVLIYAALTALAGLLSR